MLAAGLESAALEHAELTGPARLREYAQADYGAAAGRAGDQLPGRWYGSGPSMLKRSRITKEP